MRSILLTLHEVAAALVFLHALGIVHGDLSPNNVLLECVLGVCVEAWAEVQCVWRLQQPG